MLQDELKKQVAQAAIDLVIPKLAPDDVLGIGTGTTANFFIDLLAPYKDKFRGTISSSEQSSKLLESHGIKVFSLSDVPRLRFYVDGADEINSRLQMIKGGGAALTREKIVAAVSDEFVCIADESKWVEILGKFPLPVEIVPIARNHVINELAQLGVTAEYREGVITDNGGEILDIHGLTINDAPTMEVRINQITGVITNGIFALRPADIVLLATEDGVKSITIKAQVNR
ncbi:MAG: ribose 5-phosphate isomerase A [Alteromonadaceae bacterium]|nr:MAG: ribose 5-phosphate isomerase A [Alteromonadaceae bacterium]